MIVLCHFGDRGRIVSSVKRKKRRYSMQVYEELKARGLIAQVTDEEEIREMVNNGKATFLSLIHI